MPAEPSRAVFLSYASQDAEAARRICEALRSGGVEVWFDADGGLEHGDEWDQKIRRQIKECVLFIPVISASTQARQEGYFRIEWELAAQRAMGIASGVPFILPVVIDDTREPDALVPDRFRTVQWTRFRGGEVPADVRARFLKLWSHRTGMLKDEAAQASAPAVHAAPSAAETIGKPGANNYALIAVAVVVIVGGAGWWLLGGRNKSAASSSAPAAVAPQSAPKPPATAPRSEARQLADKARALFDSLDGTRDDYKLAEELIEKAKAKDSTDAEVCAAEAQLHERFLQRGWDPSDARRESARAAVQRAVRLDPQSFEVRWAQAGLLGLTGREGEERERQLRELRRERPKDQRILRALGTVIDRLGRLDEAIPIFDESAALPGGDPLALYIKSQACWFEGRTTEAESAIESAIAQQPFTGALLMDVWYKTILHGDLEGARALLNRIDPAQLLEDRAAYFAFYVEWLARRPDAAIARLAAFPRDWLNDSWYRGPKGLLVGDALQLAGRPDAAAVERRGALKLVEQRLATDSNNLNLLYNRFESLAQLGQRDEAERVFALITQMSGADPAQASSGRASWMRVLLGRKADAIRVIAAGLKRGTHAVEFTAADLRLNPGWDPLRSEQEFAAVIAEAERIEQAAALSSTAPAVKSTAEQTPAVLSPARELIEKAQALFQGVDATREDFALAEEFCQRALKLDSIDGEIWAVYSNLNAAFGYRGWDTTPERREQTRVMAERAIRLAPASPLAKLAQAGAWSAFGINRAETEKLLREVVQEQPNNQMALRFLAVTVLNRDGLDECLALNERSAALPGGDALALYSNARYLWQRSRQADAYAMLQRSLAQRPFSSSLVLKTLMEMTWRGDLAAAEATLQQIPQSAQLEDRANYTAGLVRFYQRRADAALAAWGTFPRDYYNDFQFDGPKGLLIGLADELDHRDAAAKIEWRAALQAVEKRIAATPNNPTPYFYKAYLLACLGEKASAEEVLRTHEQLAGVKSTAGSPLSFDLALVYARLGRLDDFFARPPTGNLARIRIDPRFDALRADSRFEKLLADNQQRRADAKK